MSNTFHKYERLCGQLHIAALYNEGRKFTVWPMRVTYKPAEHTQVLIWAPKSLHKHATDRNLLRRRMREAWRLNKSELADNYCLAFNYIDKSIQPYALIARAVKKAVKRLNEENHS